MKNQAFTLIELLVVVLIIGILAAIAVPQYQLAVGKSKFSAVKNMAKALVQAEESYFLANGHYTENFSDLDVSKTSEAKCSLWAEVNGQTLACWTSVNNVQMGYYQYFIGGRNKGARLCLAFSLDKNDIPNRICQQETGKTADQAICSQGGGDCDYYY